MKPNALMSTAIAISCGCLGTMLGTKTGENIADEKWQRRTREAGFSIVTRYDVLTGEAKQVLIKLPVAEVKP